VGNALIEVTTDAKTEVIARYLSTLQNPAVEVVSSTASRIEIKPARKLRVGFVSPKEGELIYASAIDASVEVSGPVSGVTIDGVPATSSGQGRWAARVTLRAGQTSIVAAARDDLGRQAQATVSIRRDQRPPTVKILSPRSGATGNASVRVTVQAEDDGPGVTVHVNGAPAALTNGRYVADVALNPGRNAITARAEDAAGRSATDAIELILDANPPSLTIVEPTRHLTNQPNVTVIANAFDREGSVNVDANGTRLIATGSAGAFSGQLTLRDGQNIIVVTATDQAGLTTERRVQVMLDRTPPVLTGQVVAIIEGSTEPGSTVSYGGKPISVDSDGNFRLTVQAPPGGTITIIATDAAGNRSEQVYRIGGSAELTPSTEEIR
jgi:hypothetical protein